jgi:nucleotide-binding universal stress UspA family protein
MLVCLHPVPRMYQGLPDMGVQIPRIIEGNSELGRHLQCLVVRLEAYGIGVVVKMTEGVPKWVIQQEMIEGDYDLVSVAAEPGNWLRRIFLSSVVEPVLGFARRPIFIARPPNGQS